MVEMSKSKNYVRNRPPDAFIKQQDQFDKQARTNKKDMVDF